MDFCVSEKKTKNVNVLFECLMSFCHLCGAAGGDKFFVFRPPASSRIEPAAGSAPQSRVSTGESVQGDRHPEETGPS